MRKLYNEFFYIPKHGKIREKVMLACAAMTIAIMIVCLAAMSITAYAYFSYNVTSGSNIIKAANFEADVSISITENDSSTAVVVSKEKNSAYTADLKAGNTYTITLDESNGSTATTGFCVVSAVGCPDTYHSQQIGADTTVEGGITDKVTFQLSVTADTTVTFISHWGTSSYYADYSKKGEDDKLYITNADIGDSKVVMRIDEIDEADNDIDKETANTTTDDTITTEPSTTPTDESVTTPSTETTQPIETTTPETTGTSESTSTTEPSTSTTESTITQSAEKTTTETNGTETTEPAATEPAATTETQSTTENSETTGAPTTESEVQTTEPTVTATEPTTTAQPKEETKPTITTTPTELSATEYTSLTI